MWVRYQNPIPDNPALIFTPAWVSSLAVGLDAIYLEGVDGNLDLTHPGTPKQPAYLLK
jgi:hypothetical protein